MIVACEDRVTAPSYFRELKLIVEHFVTVQVVPPSSGKTSPRAVLASARRSWEELKRNQQEDEGTRDSVWAVIDMECDAERRKQAEDAKESGEDTVVNVVLSNPCYEIWTLLHLEDTGEYFNNCAQILDHIKPLWQKKIGHSFARKTQADYVKIHKWRRDACERAKKHRENNDQSWTEVYKIIEAIESLDPQRGSDVA